MSIRKAFWFGALLLAIASGAQAVPFPMSGTWKSNRGPQIVIPVFAGGQCAHPALGMGVFCGIGVVNAAGLNAGDQLSLPASIFKETGGGVIVPVPGPTVVQLTTMIEAVGPQSPAVFQAGTKTSRPANFAWCPGATPGVGTTMNPNCLTGKATGTGAPPGSGVRPGRVRYTAGPNQFGGVAQMLLSGGGTVGVFIGGTPMAQQILHNPFGGGATPNDQEGGGSYQNTGSVMLAPGNITLQTMTVGGQGKATTGGIITAMGPIIAMGGPETNYTTGFPFTTGKVQATNPTTGMGRGTTMLTLTGMDQMTTMGGRNLVMVSSALTKRIVAGTSFLHLENMTMTIPEPGAVASLVSGAALLATLAYRSRRAGR